MAYSSYDDIYQETTVHYQPGPTILLHQV